MTIPNSVVPDGSGPTMQVLALKLSNSGLLRMTSMLSGSADTDWDESIIAEWLQFPGVPASDFTVRRFDSARGIIDIDFDRNSRSHILNRWLNSVEVGSRTRIGRSLHGHLPNFESGRAVLMFADQTSLPAVHSILSHWPSTATGTLWVDTPYPEAVAALPVVRQVGLVSFHTSMGFDPLVAAVRRVELDAGTTVWAAGESGRMEAIRAMCLAAGLSHDDTRVFGYWSEEASAGARLGW